MVENNLRIIKLSSFIVGVFCVISIFSPSRIVAAEPTLSQEQYDLITKEYQALARFNYQSIEWQEILDLYVFENHSKIFTTTIMPGVSACSSTKFYEHFFPEASFPKRVLLLYLIIRLITTKKLPLYTPPTCHHGYWHEYEDLQEKFQPPLLSW